MKKYFALMCLVRLELEMWPFLAKDKSTHIILIDEGGWYNIPLCLKEIARPKDVASFIIEPDNLSFSGTLRVEFLFVRWADSGHMTEC